MKFLGYLLIPRSVHLVIGTNSWVEILEAVSPMTDYKNRMLNTKDKLAQSFVEIGYQRKRDNDRKDSMEVENSRLRKLEVEKTLNEQFTFLLQTSTELKMQLLEVDKEEEEFIESMLEANKKSLARIVKE
jgi:predicted nuclease with TOPRIM domain